MKRIPIPIFATLAILSIAACSQSGPVDKEANEVAPATTPAAPEGTAPTAGSAAGGPPPMSNDAQQGAAIPAALQGRWGLTPADCTSTRGDAKGLLIITGDALKFYESRAVPATSIETGTNSISGQFNFTGEGQTWTKYESLKLQNDGLTRTERNPVASYTYAKCD